MDDLNRLKVVLVEQKKTGKWLAEQLGVSTTTTSRWCSNASQPDLQTLNKILRVLDSFNQEEQRYFKGVFFLGNSEPVISEELQCADKRIRHIKKSSIIKFALAMDLAILK
jgi:transcriptional regulator with XRE-family HTH domain